MDSSEKIIQQYKNKLEVLHHEIGRCQEAIIKTTGLLNTTRSDLVSRINGNILHDKVRAICEQLDSDLSQLNAYKSDLTKLIGEFSEKLEYAKQRAEENKGAGK